MLATTVATRRTGGEGPVGMSGGGGLSTTSGCFERRPPLPYRPLPDALECVVALARTHPEIPNSVRFAYPGPLVDRLYVGELKRDVS